MSRPIIPRIVPHKYMRYGEIDVALGFRDPLQQVPITRKQIFVFWNRVRKWKLSGQVTYTLDPSYYDESQTFDFTTDGPEIERALFEHPADSGEYEDSLARNPVNLLDDPEGYISWDLQAIDFPISNATHYLNGATTGVVGAKLTLRIGQWFYPLQNPANDPQLIYPVWSDEWGGLIQCDVSITGETWQSESVDPDVSLQDSFAQTNAQGTTIEGDFPDDDAENGLRFNLESDIWTFVRQVGPDDGSGFANNDVVTVAVGTKFAPSLWLPYTLDGVNRFDPSTGVRLD